VSRSNPANEIARITFHIPAYGTYPTKFSVWLRTSPRGNPKQGTTYENGPNYLLAKPCNIHTLLDDLAIVYAKLLPSGASV
jgi:hypothetical protein